MSSMDEVTSVVDHNDVQQLQAALSQQPSLATASNDGGYTLLHRAASMGSTECLQVLLAAGASTEATSTEGGCHSSLLGGAGRP